MFSDGLVEKNKVFLRNLNTGKNTENTWVAGAAGAYGYYEIPYETPLCINHVYYKKYSYKYSTTNQAPTWQRFWLQGGSVAGTTLTPSTSEQTISEIQWCTAVSRPLTGGRMYHGDSGKIAGAIGYVKNVLIYDVTELYDILRSANIATTDATLKTWCDNNLTYCGPYKDYDITSKVSDATAKSTIYQGRVVTKEIIESEGLVKKYGASATIKANCYFDETSPLGVYNNSGNGTVVHTRIASYKENSPFGARHPYILQIQTNGTASPNAGGFVETHSSAANKVFIEKFVAKIPIGYQFTMHCNSQGTGATTSYLTNRLGTGEWEEYAVKYVCGSSGTFSTGGHITIGPTSSSSKNLLKWGLFDDLWTLTDFSNRTKSIIQNQIWHIESQITASADTMISCKAKSMITLPANTTLYLSYDIRSNVLTTWNTNSSGYYNRLYDGSTYTYFIAINNTFTADEKWHRISFRITTGSATSYTLELSTDQNWYGANKYIDIRNIMLSTSSETTTYSAYQDATYVRWFVAAAANCDLTGVTQYEGYTLMPGKTIFKAGYIFANEFCTNGIYPNGNLSSAEPAMLPSGWYYDNFDFPTSGNCRASRSIVQPVGGGSGILSIGMNIDQTSRYKVSYWVKCKQDMTSFLSAAVYRTSTNQELSHGTHIYVPNTRTTLARACTSTDTVLYLTSVANWTTTRAYGRIGFRSTSYTSYNDRGISPGSSTSGGCIITAIDTTNNTLTLEKGCGVNAAAGTYVVESYDGGTYPYPIAKAQLPTNNTWKYVEGYFGVANTASDGGTSGWGGIPYDATNMYLRINIYANTGTVPIKYADIRIERVNSGSRERLEKKVQLEKNN